MKPIKIVLNLDPSEICSEILFIDCLNKTLGFLKNSNYIIEYFFVKRKEKVKEKWKKNFTWFLSWLTIALSLRIGSAVVCLSNIGTNPFGKDFDLSRTLMFQ